MGSGDRSARQVLAGHERPRGFRGARPESGARAPRGSVVESTKYRQNPRAASDAAAPAARPNGRRVEAHGAHVVVGARRLGPRDVRRRCRGHVRARSSVARNPWRVRRHPKVRASRPGQHGRRRDHLGHLGDVSFARGAAIQPHDPLWNGGLVVGLHLRRTSAPHASESPVDRPRRGSLGGVVCEPWSVGISISIGISNIGTSNISIGIGTSNIGTSTSNISMR